MAQDTILSTLTRDPCVKLCYIRRDLAKTGPPLVGSEPRFLGFCMFFDKSATDARFVM